MGEEILRFIATRAPLGVRNQWLIVDPERRWVDESSVPAEPSGGPEGEDHNPNHPRRGPTPTGRGERSSFADVLTDLRASSLKSVDTMVSCADSILGAARDEVGGAELVQRINRTLGRPDGTVQALIASADWIRWKSGTANQWNAQGQDLGRLLLIAGLLERVLAGGHQLDAPAQVADWLSKAFVLEPTIEGSEVTDRPTRTLPLYTGILAVIRAARPPRFASPRLRQTKLRVPVDGLCYPPYLGELVVVERELCGYEIEELADTQPILAGETKVSSLRVKDETETRQLTDRESLKNTVESTEKRSKASLRTEAQETLRNDSRFDATLDVEAQYPPYVKVNAHAGYQRESSSSSSSEIAAEIANETVEYAAKAVSDRERKTLESTTLRKRDELDRHEFKPLNQSRNGLYYFIDSVWTVTTRQSKDKRLLCEFLLSQPADWLRVQLEERPAVAVEIEEPTAPKVQEGDKERDLRPTDITNANWDRLASEYPEAALEPPPNPVVEVSFGIKAPSLSEQPQINFDLHDDLPIPDGYCAVGWRCSLVSFAAPNLPQKDRHWITLMVGDDEYRNQVAGTEESAPGGFFENVTTSLSSLLGRTLGVQGSKVSQGFKKNIASGFMGVQVSPQSDATIASPEVLVGKLFGGVGAPVVTSDWGKASYYQLRNLERSVPVSLQSGVARGYAANVTLACIVTRESWRQWQVRCYRQLMAAFQNRLRDYEDAVAAARIRQGEPPAGLRSSDALRLINTELRRQCLQKLEGTNNLEHLTDERFLFLEQAFEWRVLQYVLYGYYSATDHKAYPRLALADGPDAVLAEFFRAGRVRVVVPVRRGFEQVALRYLSTGETWSIARPPVRKPSDDPGVYVSLVAELVESNQGIADDWRTIATRSLRLPTPHLYVSDSLSQCQPREEPAPAVMGGDEGVIHA